MAGANHLILETPGHSHYVGCPLSVYSLRRSPGWGVPVTRNHESSPERHDEPDDEQE